MALTRKDVLLAALYFLSGIFLLETGVLCLFVASAYRALRGSPAAALTGVILLFLGGLLLVRSRRRLSRKE